MYSGFIRGGKHKMLIISQTGVINLDPPSDKYTALGPAPFKAYYVVKE